MCKIALVTYKRHVFDSLREDINEVLGEKAEFNCYLFSEINFNTKFNEDIILTFDYNNLDLIRPYVDDMNKVIIAQRTFKEKDIIPILQIPSYYNVLVASDSKQSILQIIHLLSQIIKSNLNFIAYDCEKDQNNVDYIITLGKEQFEFTDDKKVININNRCIDIYTFMKIINKLNLNDEDIMIRLLIYSRKTVNIKGEIKKQYEELFERGELLNNIVERFNEGIVITDDNYKVIYYNIKAKDMLKINGKRFNLKNVFKCDKISTKLINIYDKSILVSKTSINYIGKENDYVFNLKEDLYIGDLKESLSNELKNKGLFAKYTFNSILYKSKKMQNVIELAKKISKTDHSLLILGYTGTGKELFAQSVHNESSRKYKPFVAINCAALPENLLESELFGYERGSFTGASREGKLGLFEQADEGTIFLDEIGDMPVSLQSRLLRVLQEKQIMRIGSNKVINVNVRIISATNQNLEELILQGKFRSDLYYRLNVFRIEIPSLAKRKDDIPFMLEYFSDGKSKKLNIESFKTIMSYPWPGNVRELQNVGYYINVMEQIPQYIYDYKSQNPLSEISISTCTPIEAYYILKCLKYFYDSEEIIGREKLNKKLNTLFIKISEYKLRIILDEFSDSNWITKAPNGRGFYISLKGINILNELNSIIKKESIG